MKNTNKQLDTEGVPPSIIAPILALLILVAGVVFFVSGCTTYIGLGYHPMHSDAPEMLVENPVGIVGGSTQFGDFDLFAEHHSGLLVRDVGAGYNLVGIKYYITRE